MCTNADAFPLPIPLYSPHHVNVCDERMRSFHIRIHIRCGTTSNECRNHNIEHTFSMVYVYIYIYILRSSSELAWTFMSVFLCCVMPRAMSVCLSHWVDWFSVAAVDSFRRMQHATGAKRWSVQNSQNTRGRNERDENINTGCHRRRRQRRHRQRRQRRLHRFLRVTRLVSHCVVAVAWMLYQRYEISVIYTVYSQLNHHKTYIYTIVCSFCDQMRQHKWPAFEVYIKCIEKKKHQHSSTVVHPILSWMRVVVNSV